MNRKLRWEPVHQEEFTLPDELKKAIVKHYWGSDGSDRDNLTTRVHIGEDDIPYFEGLADAGVASAVDVLDILRSHKEIYLHIS